MNPYSDFIQTLGTRTSEARHKYSQARHPLRKMAMAAHSKQMLGGTDRQALKNFAEIQERIGKLDRNEHMTRACETISRMEAAERELESVDAQIGGELSMLQSSIVTSGTVPAASASAIISLFERWQNALRQVESGREALGRILENVEATISLCERLAEGASSPAACPEAAHGQPAGADLKGMAFLRYLLMELITFHVVGCGREKGMPDCCSKLSAYRVMHTAPPYRSAEHIKPLIKELAARVERDLEVLRRNGNEIRLNTAAFNSALAAYFELTSSMPRDIILAESRRVVRDFDSSKASGKFMRAMHDLRRHHVETARQAATLARVDPLGFLPEFIGEDRRLFLLDVYGDQLEAGGYDIFARGFMAEIDARLGDGAVPPHMGFPEALFSRACVADTLRANRLPEGLILLVPPMNFALEHGGFASAASVPSPPSTSSVGQQVMNHIKEITRRKLFT